MWRPRHCTSSHTLTCLSFICAADEFAGSRRNFWYCLIFTARCAHRGNAVETYPCVCLSVCHTRVHELLIGNTRVFLHWRSWRNSDSHPNGAKFTWTGKICDFRSISRYISETTQDRNVVTVKLEWNLCVIYVSIYTSINFTICLEGLFKVDFTVTLKTNNMVSKTVQERSIFTLFEY